MVNHSPACPGIIYINLVICKDILFEKTLDISLIFSKAYIWTVNKINIPEQI